MISIADLLPFAFDQRPENRRRRDEPAAAPAWESLRSEAFFEDLDPAPALQVMSGPVQRLPLAA
jgi:hypothetical protein